MTTITARDNGPLLIESEDVRVCDATGTAFPAQKRNIALCRCGSSSKKPFCDGAHARVGFQAADRAVV